MKTYLLIGSMLILIGAIFFFLSIDDEVSMPVSTPEESAADEEVREPSVVPSLTMTSWVWQETRLTNDESITPEQPGTFVLSFIDEERFGAQTDCNNVGGSYVHEGNVLRFEQMMATKMACMNETQEAEFTRMLEQVESIRVDDDDALILGLRARAGEMVFTFIEG